MFTVWSPFDGEPIPAPNETERDILLSQGYLAQPPEADDGAGKPHWIGEQGPELLDPAKLAKLAESSGQPDPDDL